MSRTVYIKRGPGNWIAGSLAVATMAGAVWVLWQAIRFTYRRRATAAAPLIVVLVDELAFLTAYIPDRKQRDVVNQLLATLPAHGRAVSVSVVAALQDPGKDVIAYRNLFPTKVALRLDEKGQVDMVLGDGARNAGAYCDRIPENTPGAG